MPYSAVREGKTCHRDWRGNQEADRLAKKGAEPFRAADEDLLLLGGLHEIAKRVARFGALQQAVLPHEECRDHVGFGWM
eukprot:2269005-Pyramimonas_sp.AAC.1